MKYLATHLIFGTVKNLANIFHTFCKFHFQFDYYQQQAEYYESYIADCLLKQSSVSQS